MERMTRCSGAVSVRDLGYTPRGASLPVLSGISFDVCPGELVLLAGPSGSGKTTMLRAIKPEPPLPGLLSGVLTVGGRDIRQMSSAEQAEAIGFVSRDPEGQTVTDTVSSELAFCAENLGYPSSLTALRVAETASWFGIDGIVDKKTSTLSGGKKQLLALAAAAVTHPSLLLLDEPTSGLDPVAADAFLSAVKRLNRELGITIIIAEHRLGPLLGDASKLLLLDGGKLVFDGDPREGAEKLLSIRAVAPEAPAAARFAHAMGARGRLPVTVAEGRAFAAGLPVRTAAFDRQAESPDGEPVLKMRNVRFRYEKDMPDVLKNFSVDLHTGESAALLGGNGSGKTTVLLTAAGILRPYAGVCRIFGEDPSAGKTRRKREPGKRIGILPQNVRLLFSGFSVKEELKAAGVPDADIPEALKGRLETCSYDLSGGESRLLGLAMVLAQKPGLLLLDEPTCGLDGGAKEELASLIRKLASEGVAVLTVTHDCEFAAECSDRVIMMFDGRAAGSGAPGEFFCEADFYTTDIRRITSPFAGGCVTLSDALSAFEAKDSGEGGEP